MIFQKRKYPDMQALATAFASGELSRDEWRLVMDNDSSHLIYVGPVPEGLTARQEDDFRDGKTDHGSQLFRGSGYSDVVDACIAAGIPTEWC